MTRYECLKGIASEVGQSLVITIGGGGSTEWGAVRPGEGNMRVRTLGLVQSIALGLALSLPSEASPFRYPVACCGVVHCLGPGGGTTLIPSVFSI